MAASSVTGVGLGAVNSSKGPGNGRNFFVSKSDPHIVISGIIQTAPSEDSAWKEEIVFPNVLPGSPDNYVVMIMQSDYTNNDGHGSQPPHVEKLDGEGNNRDNEDHSWGATGFKGFVLHSGDGSNREFMYMVATVGTVAK